MEIISQMDAARKGLARYFTGKPCKRGHLSERYVASGTCCECHKVDQVEKSRLIRELREKAKQEAVNQRDED